MLYEMRVTVVLVAKIFIDSEKFCIFVAGIKNIYLNMTIVSTRDFRANQTKYFEMVDRGEQVVLRSRRGHYRLTPVSTEESQMPGRDVTAEICQGMKDFRDYLDGDKSKMLTWEEMMDELRD